MLPNHQKWDKEGVRVDEANIFKSIFKYGRNSLQYSAIYPLTLQVMRIIYPKIQQKSSKSLCIYHLSNFKLV